jgi:NADH-quinone oxidoreductase subunit A
MAQEKYLSAFGEVLLFIVAGVLFILVTLLVSRLVRPSRPNSQKLSTYESGEEPVGSPWPQFNIRFYVVALIFLLFEVEIVFMFPWATIYADKNIQQAVPAWGWLSLGEMILFIVILAFGLVYAWRNGFLEWEKPNPSPTVHVTKVPADLYHAINEKYKRKEKQN